MAWSYNGYCYPTLENIGDIVKSTDTYVLSNGWSFPSSYTVQAGTGTITYTLLYKAGGATTVMGSVPGGSFSRNYSPCTNVGYLTNYSGLELTDAVSVSWMVVLVWVTAYTFKMWRQAARGY